MDNYKLRFIPLGGIVDVTKNMYVYELYKNEELTDILIVDCGIGFPKEKELGVDFIIPDISYLLDRVDKIRAILLTHGHEDHISALRFHYEALGRPPLYGSKLTSLFVEEKFLEVGIKLRPTEIQFRKDYQFGPFTARFIHMTHSIPDTTHILIKTPVGSMYHGPDFKLDLTPPYSQPPDFYEITKAGEEGVLCLLSDCLGVGREGLTLSENIVGKTFEDEIRSTKGKFIMTTFSSNISRIRQCAEAAVKFNRAVCFLGRSMKDNTTLANEIGYLPIPKKFMIDDRQVARMAPNKVCIIAAGSQGQFDSALSKISQGQNRFIKIEKNDKVFFSSDPIPGQEEDVYDLIERLYLLGADVVYSDVAERLHASGHGNQEDIKFLMRFVKAKYLMPIGGTVRHQRLYRDVAKQLGYTDDKIVLLKEGETFIYEKSSAYAGQPVETKNIFVDAYGVGDVGSTILRDRKTLSQEGIVFCALIVDRNMNLTQKPQVSSRGFILKEDEREIFNTATNEVEKFFQSVKNQTPSEAGIRQDVIKMLESHFSRATGRKPLVVVEVIPM
jgi:ribonuclease J